MRLGVLDIGSNTVHLLVVDAYPGAAPLPAFSHKVDLRLAEHLDPDNTLSHTGEKQLTTVVSEALRIAEDKGVEDVIAFATSAIRDADNGDDVLSRVQERTGAHIRVLSGEHEARLTFLAARRWFGWSSGRLLVVDIGGGSLEIAALHRLQLLLVPEGPGRQLLRVLLRHGLHHRRPAVEARGPGGCPRPVQLGPAASAVVPGPGGPGRPDDRQP